MKSQAGRMKKSPWGADQLRQGQDLHQFQQFKIRAFQFKGRLYDILKFSAPYWNCFPKRLMPACYSFFIPLLSFSRFNPAPMESQGKALKDL